MPRFNGCDSFHELMKLLLKLLIQVLTVPLSHLFQLLCHSLNSIFREYDLVLILVAIH